ncbi:MAG: hypothetical protein GY730_05895 [bacterium]|nr:hypothetical protein [bacterium]
MNIEKVKLIIQYALMIASQEDEYHERQLGPIHFIKYVYISDLEYAKFNDGKTFTEAPWIFYNFGPWSNEVNTLIPIALNEIGAVERNMESNFSESDYIRWTLDGQETTQSDSIGVTLPDIIKRALKKYVHKYKNETATLLQFVYITLPMLNATPGESLDFSCATKSKHKAQIEQKSIEREFMPFLEKLSLSEKNLFQAKMDSLKSKFQEKIKKKKIIYTPKYDKVYEEGIEWLDDLAGERFPASAIDVEIDASLWKSKARKENE